jgi:hypothetical protein
LKAAQLLTALLALCAPASAVQLSTSTALAVTHEYLMYDNAITGSNEGGSFLTPRKHTADTLQLLFTREGEVKWEGALDGRATDDPRVDLKRFNATRMHLKAESERFSAQAGDFFASFSEYTLGKSLKGAAYTHKLKDGTQLSALGGFDKPNWDDAWNHNYDETVDRRVFGVRAQRPFLTDGQLGVSLVTSMDERARYNDAAATQDQRVAGIDWALPAFWHVSLSGESAFSHTQTEQEGFDENFDPIRVHSHKGGWAHKVNGRFNYRRFKTSNEFERVSPDYETTVGAAAPDLIRVHTSNTMTIHGPWKWILLNYTYFHNGLARQEGADISHTRMPETGLRFEAPDARPDFAFEAKLRHREVTSTFEGLRRRTRSVISSVSDRFGPFSLTAEYTFQHEDKSDGSESFRHHIFGVGSNFFWQHATGWKIAQGVRWDLQRDRDNLIAKTDQTGTVKLNANVTTPWGVDGGTTYSRTLVANAVNPGNDRRAWTASLGYNILKSDAHRVEFRWRQNDNRFDDPGQDYKEMTWEFALNNRF